jgi:hypothetical protein
MKPPHTASPRDHLDAVGKAIFGEAYKAPMARELRVGLRTLRRWVSDASDLAWNHGAIADLRAVLADEHAEVLAHEVELRTALEDLDMAIKSYRMREAGGGDEDVRLGLLRRLGAVGGSVNERQAIVFGGLRGYDWEAERPVAQ